MSQLNKKAKTLQQQYAKATNEAKRQKLKGSINSLRRQQHTLEEAKTIYHQALQSITQAIHPFNLSTLEWQLFSEVSKRLSAPLEQLCDLSESYGGQKATKAIDNFQKQIPSMTQGINAWWRWVDEALKVQNKWVTTKVNSGLSGVGGSVPNINVLPQLLKGETAIYQAFTMRGEGSANKP